MNTRLLFYILFITSLFTLASCACDAPTMVSNTWVLEKYGPKNALTPVLDPAPAPGSGVITLSFDGTNVNGSDGCNNYFGSYTQSDCDLSVGNLNTTLIACSPGIMSQASAYTTILRAVTTFRTKTNQLKLCTDDGRLLIFKKQ